MKGLCTQCDKIVKEAKEIKEKINTNNSNKKTSVDDKFSNTLDNKKAINFKIPTRTMQNEKNSVKI